MRTLWLPVAASVLSAIPAAAEVGSFTNDWTGNEIVVEAIEDPEVQGVTCHISHFERGMIDRLRKGNWFEDPPTSIACLQAGPMVIGDIERDEEGEEVFNERKSLVFKKLAVRRIYDAAHARCTSSTRARWWRAAPRWTSARSRWAPRSPGRMARS